MWLIRLSPPDLNVLSSRVLVKLRVEAIQGQLGESPRESGTESSILCLKCRSHPTPSNPSPHDHLSKPRTPLRTHRLHKQAGRQHH